MREKEEKTSIVFVRHGATDFPKDRIYCDHREDPPLNREGLDQAALASKRLAGSDIHAVYSSPSTRAAMTAQVIVADSGSEVEFSEALRERRFGIWEGLYFEQIERQFAAEYQAWKRDKAGYTPAGGETIYQLHDRVARVLGTIVEANRGQTVVVVSHVGVIRVAVAAALEMPLANYRCIQVDHASLTRIDYGVTQNNLVFCNVV